MRFTGLFTRVNQPDMFSLAVRSRESTKWKKQISREYWGLQSVARTAFVFTIGNPLCWLCAGKPWCTECKASKGDMAGIVSVTSDRLVVWIRVGIALPPGLSGTFVWNNKTIVLHEGSQEILIEWSVIKSHWLKKCKGFQACNGIPIRTEFLYCSMFYIRKPKPWDKL